MADTNHGKIKCRMPKCGQSFSSLATHIARTHKMSTKEYLKRFPGEKLVSDEYRIKASIRQKKSFANNPLLREKVSARTFDFIKNKKLAPLLQRDYKAAQTCLKNSLWKPSIILYGSIVEAILLEKNVDAKNFYDAIEIAFKKKEISEKEYYKIHIVRDLRNFVHLRKELLEGSEINEYWAKTFSDICESLIKRFK